MPLIQVRVIKDVFSKEQKNQIISKLTDAMVSIEGETMRGVTWCVIEEVESGDWGIGGNALTTADVQALAAEKRPDKVRLRGSGYRAWTIGGGSGAPVDDASRRPLSPFSFRWSPCLGGRCRSVVHQRRLEPGARLTWRISKDGGKTRGC